VLLGDRLWVCHFLCSQPPRPTQLPTFSAVVTEAGESSSIGDRSVCHQRAVAVIVFLSSF